MRKPVIAIFSGAVLLLGMALTWLLPDRSFSPQENRMLAQLPAFSAQSLVEGAYIPKLERYLQDQFPFREGWVNAQYHMAALQGLREHNGVYLGRDGRFLEQLGDSDAKALAYNQHALNQIGQKTGRPVYLMPVLSQSACVPELLPDNAPVPDQRAQLAALMRGMSEAVRLADPSDQLGAEDYYRTDHHWNHLGAREGYRALRRAMGLEPREDFTYTQVSEGFIGTLASKAGAFDAAGDAVFRIDAPGLEAITYTVADTDTTYPSLYRPDKLAEKDQYAYYLGGNHALAVSHNPAGRGKLLLLKDSYAHVLLPYLARDYAQVHVMDLRYYQGDVLAYIQQQGIDQVAAVYTLNKLVTEPCFGRLGYTG